MSEKDFDKGYKSGFKFGKEVANEEWMNRIKQAREEIEQLKHEHTDVEGYRWWNNAIENCLHELDKLMAESED